MFRLQNGFWLPAKTFYLSLSLSLSLAKNFSGAELMMLQSQTASYQAKS